MWEIMGGLLVGTAVSGVVPFVNAELLVVAAAAALPGIGVPIVTAVSTVGQMSTKIVLFALAKWAPSRLPERARAALERAAQKVAERDRAAGSLVFTSAFTGLPPFYGVSLVSGALGVSFGTFVVTGFLGRAARFGLLAWGASAIGPDILELFASLGAPTVLAGVTP